MHGGGRIAVLVNVNSEIVNDAVKEAAKNVAMQVAGTESSLQYAR